MAEATTPSTWDPVLWGRYTLALELLSWLDDVPVSPAYSEMVLSMLRCRLEDDIARTQRSLVCGRTEEPG